MNTAAKLLISSNSIDFLRVCIDTSNFKLTDLKVFLDPVMVEFYCVVVNVPKVIALRYKARRGDKKEWDLYLVIECKYPFVFVLEVAAKVRIFGEGIYSARIIYRPSKIPLGVDIVEGRLIVYSSSGKVLSECKLVGKVEKTFNVQQNSYDCGWTILNHPKECSAKLINLSRDVINVNLKLQRDETESSPFFLKARSVRLDPGKESYINFTFVSSSYGYFTDIISADNGSGETINITISGIAGIPFAIHVEDPALGLESLGVLTEERNKFVTHFKSGSVLDKDDNLLLGRIMEQYNSSSCGAYVINMGVCQSDSIARAVTLMNFTDVPLLFSSVSREKTLSLPSVIRVPPCSTCIFSVDLVTDSILGNFQGSIDIFSHDMGSFRLIVTAFIGQPLYFPVYEQVFFRPAEKINQKQSLTLYLINESQFDIPIFAAGINDNIFTVSMPLAISEKVPLIAPRLGMIPIVFTFNPAGAGIYQMAFKIQIAAGATFSALYQAELKIYGICFDPSIDRVLSLQILGIFIANLSKPNASRETVIFEPAALAFPTRPSFAFNSDNFTIEGSPDLMATFDTLTHGNISTIMIQNNLTTNQTLQVFGSSSVRFSPAIKELRPSEYTNLDIDFTPVHKNDNLMAIHAFCVALDMETGHITATQITKSVGRGILCLPLYSKNAIFDFGIVDISSIYNENTKYLMICNTQSVSYRWAIKPARATVKSLAFFCAVDAGELAPYETFTVPFEFKCNVTGTFTYNCEFHVYECDKRESITTYPISLKAVAVNVAHNRIIDQIDFSNNLPNKVRRSTFVIDNLGTSILNVMSFIESPFAVKPQSIKIGPKTSQKFEVSFVSCESRTYKGKLQLSINGIFHMIDLSGIVGCANLLLEKYGGTRKHLGVLKDSTITWFSLFLRNEGTLPAKMVGIYSATPNFFKVNLVGILPNTPMDYFDDHDSVYTIFTIVCCQKRLLGDL